MNNGHSQEEQKKMTSINKGLNARELLREMFHAKLEASELELRAKLILSEQLIRKEFIAAVHDDDDMIDEIAGEVFDEMYDMVVDECIALIKEAAMRGHGA
jgi:hypothetical protein